MLGEVFGIALSLGLVVLAIAGLDWLQRNLPDALGEATGGDSFAGGGDGHKAASRQGTQFNQRNKLRSHFGTEAQ